MLKVRSGLTLPAYNAPVPRSLGNQLPSNLLSLFDGSDLAGRLGHTFLLLTTDAEGWPHLAMLSVGEVLAADPHTLQAALWTSSSATANLAREGRALLALVEGNAAYYLRVRAQRQPDIDLGPSGPRAHFRLDIDDVREDAVGYATL